MRKLLFTLLVVGLVAAPSMASVSVQVSVSPSTINVGQQATVTVKVMGTPSVAVSALAGSVQAATSGVVSASNFAFDAAFHRTGQFPEVVGSANAAGGWDNFGSGQNTQLMNTDAAQYGQGAYVNFCQFTVTGVAAGSTALNFVAGEVGGFLPISTDSDQTVASNTGATVTVQGGNPPTVTTISPSPALTGNGALAGTLYLAPAPATNDLTLTPTYGGGAATSYAWSVVSATAAPYGALVPGVSFETITGATTRVRFNRNGTYVLKVTATNDSGSGSNQITIRVTSADFDASGGNVNAADRTKFVGAFGNATNPWADFDGSGGNVNAADRTKFVGAFGKSAVQTAYPSDTPFHQ